jgi:hypothetical protein
MIIYIIKHIESNTIETALKNKNDFNNWLKYHNECRDAEPEKENEFEITPLNVFCIKESK